MLWKHWDKKHGQILMKTRTWDTGLHSYLSASPSQFLLWVSDLKEHQIWIQKIWILVLVLTSSNLQL